MDNKKLINRLQKQLKRVAREKTKAWWERYLKHTIPFRGVNLVVLRDELRSWYKVENIAVMAPEEKLDLGLAFFDEEYAEDKLAGVLFLEEYLPRDFDWRSLLNRFEELFVRELIFDWNLCDWFCIRVLGPMIREGGITCARAVASWSKAEYLWQARASVVAFVILMKEHRFAPVVIRACTDLIKREERFAKTGVGWVLRELSKSDRQRVVQFIDRHKAWFTKEALSNATKYFKGHETRLSQKREAAND
jgi:3-methyladenine DNA glycosylase AlkD